MLYILTEVTPYAEKDAHKRADKHLPNTADLNVNIKVAGNELLWKMLKDSGLNEQFKTEKPDLKIDHELLRKNYISLAETQEYNYIHHSLVVKKNEEKNPGIYIERFATGQRVIFILYRRKIFR